MAQNRDAPAYQEYAASMLAHRQFRLMSLEARGLLYTMRLECWVNEKLPSRADQLARVLGLDPHQVERVLPEVTALFRVDGADLRCEELDDYKAHLAGRRQRQSEGGRAGAAKTNKWRHRDGTGNPTGEPRGTRGSLVQNSKAKTSQDKQPEATNPDAAMGHKEWVNEYERASRGH